MGRWLLLLPLFLFLRDQAPLARSGAVTLAEDCHATLGDPCADPSEHLRQTDPLAFLEKCLQRTRAEVTGYTAIFRKREKLGGKLENPEEIQIAFSEKPFRVYMNWLSGARLTTAKKLIYAAGENNGKLLALPTLPFLPILTKDIHGSEATSGSRYTVDQFGMGLGMERSIGSMTRAKARGQLHLKYHGEVQEPRVGDNITCYKFVRKPYEPLEEDNLNELTIYVDKATGLQVGSVLKDDKGNLVAEYFFREVKLNPTFPDWQFTRAALQRK